MALQIDEFLTTGKMGELEEADNPAKANPADPGQTPQGDAKMAAAFL